MSFALSKPVLNMAAWLAPVEAVDKSASTKCSRLQQYKNNYGIFYEGDKDSQQCRDISLLAFIFKCAVDSPWVLALTGPMPYFAVLSLYARPVVVLSYYTILRIQFEIFPERTSKAWISTSPFFADKGESVLANGVFVHSSILSWWSAYFYHRKRLVWTLKRLNLLLSLCVVLRCIFSLLSYVVAALF